jgi:uncharacterized iron-regulated protein
MKRLCLALLLLGILTSIFLPCSCVVRGGKMLRVSDGTVVALNDVLEDLKRAQLVFVGELHDRKNHHEIQLAVIRTFKDAGTPVAIGLEMFRRESQANLNRWINNELAEKDFRKVYYDNWTFAWSLYRDIFLYARKHKIPMIGLNVPREITQQVARGGFASLTGEQIGELPMVSCDVDATYMEFIRRSFGAHAHGAMDFIHFCEAQIVWDTAMAWNLLAFLKENPKFTVVVLAGNGHAWKRGIPEQIQRQSTISYRVILPEEPGRSDRKDVSLEDTDYLWLRP